jgi:hypothetical protein
MLNRAQSGQSSAAQRGQVLIFCLGMLIAGAGVLILMFDTTQVVTAKSRLVQAADASAYSAAAWRARVFNYIAYSNRAIIAQEISVAQAVMVQILCKIHSQHQWDRCSIPACRCNHRRNCRCSTTGQHGSSRNGPTGNPVA